MLSDRYGFLGVAGLMVSLAAILFYPLWLALVSPGPYICFGAMALLSVFYASGVPTLALGLGLFPVQYRTTLFGLCYNFSMLAFGATSPFVADALADAFTPQTGGAPLPDLQSSAAAVVAPSGTASITGRASPLSILNGRGHYASPAIWNIAACAVTLFGLWYYARAVRRGEIEASEVGRR